MTLLVLHEVTVHHSSLIEWTATLGLLKLLDSAAALREQLQSAVTTLDPGGTDSALRHIVLIGHSMGGLVSKLQVTSSSSAIWSRVANRPLETLVADEGIKARLRRDMFFESSPFVRRVVFVGTPHRGSSNRVAIRRRGVTSDL